MNIKYFELTLMFMDTLFGHNNSQQGSAKYDQVFNMQIIFES